MSTTQTGHRLVISRKYPVSRERVWQAWTDIDQMKAWLAPEGMTPGDIECDFRVGGAYRLTMVQPDGEKYIAKGVYREIRPPELLSYTWTWEEDTPAEEHETLLTLEFKDLGTETELVLTHENLKSEESRQGHTDGWNSLLDKLAKHLG